MENEYVIKGLNLDVCFQNYRRLISIINDLRIVWILLYFFIFERTLFYFDFVTEGVE